jgi:phosphoribosylanthranilate isomerase
MNKIVTQIYEIHEPKEAATMIELGVDHIGSVLLKESEWKQPSILEVIKVVKEAGRVSSLIPLFNNPDIIFQVLDYYGPHIVHFCEALVGNTGEKEDYSSLLKLQRSVGERYPHIKTMRSIPIPESSNQVQIPTLEVAKDFEDISDYFLTDTWLGNEPVTGFIGITGKTCDWDAAAELVKRSNIPVVLAGGLSGRNVKDAILKVKPFGVDSCMQTNMVDDREKPVRFKKDLQKVKEFVRSVKSLEVSNEVK